MGEFDNSSIGSQDVDLEEELQPLQLNTQVVSNVYQQELGEQMEAIGLFRNGLQETSRYYRQDEQPAGVQREAKVEKVEQMKDYIHQSLAYIAYTTTLATQKIDDGLKLQCDDLDRLGSAIGELGIQLEMKRERKSREIMSKLAQRKEEVPWSTIAVIEDPDSPWKKVPPKYHRTPIDFTILDDVGLIGAGSSSKTGNLGGRSHSIRSDRRTSVSTLSNTSSRFSGTTARRAKPVGQPQRVARPVGPPGSPGLAAAEAPPPPSGAPGIPPPPAPGAPGLPPQPPSSGAGLPSPPPPPPVAREISMTSMSSERTSTASSQREQSPPRTPSPIVSRKKGSGREAARMSFFVPPPETDESTSGIFGLINNLSNDLPELLPEEDEEMNRLPTPPPDPSFEDLPGALPF